MKIKKTLYEFEIEFENLMDDALDTLSPTNFDRLKDNILMFIDDYEE